MSDRFPSGALVFLLAGCVVPTGPQALYPCDDGQGLCNAAGQRLQPTDAGAADAGDGGGGPPADAGPGDAGCGAVLGADNIDPRAYLGAAYFEERAQAGETAQRLFAIGGVPGSSHPTGEAQFEDLVNGNTWYSAGTLHTPRSGFATVVLSPLEGVVVFGGLGPDGGLADMEHFASNANPAPSTVWAQATPVLPQPTWDHAAALEADAGPILSCGGRTGALPGHDVATCYQLTWANYWTDAGSSAPYELFGWEGGWVQAPADLSRPRTQFSMVLGPDGLVYAIGGEGPIPATDVGWEVFDGRAWTCPLACPTLAVGRIGAAAAVSGTRIYVTGGQETLGDIAGTPSVEFIDLDAGSAASWQFGAPLNYGRYNHAAVTLPNGHIRVLGGESDGCTLGIVEDYDPANNSWSVVSGA